MHVGFVGLGAMGKHMAMNILKGGHELTVHDSNPDAVAALRAAGALGSDTYAELASGRDLVITMLPNPADVEAVLLGDDGVVSGLPTGSVVVDMSTGEPLSARRFAALASTVSVEFLDCPVGRTQTHAEAGTLLLLAGGRHDVIERVRSVLDCVGSEIVHCGETGTGQAMKLVNNMLATIALQGVAEALALGLAAGLSLETIRSVTGQTMAQTAQLDTALPAKTFQGDLQPGFALSLAHKDLGLAAELARRLGVAVPVAQRTLNCCAELIDCGRGSDDIGVLVAASAPNSVPEPLSDAATPHGRTEAQR